MIKVMSFSCSYTLGPSLICTFEPYSHYTLVMSPSVFTLKISSLWLTLNVAVFSIQMSVKHYLKFLTFMCRFLFQCCHLIGWVDNGMFEKVCKCSWIKWLVSVSFPQWIQLVFQNWRKQLLVLSRQPVWVLALLLSAHYAAEQSSRWPQK